MCVSSQDEHGQTSLPMAPGESGLDTTARAARNGFDWPEVEPVFDKVEEELNELRQAFESGDQQQQQNLSENRLHARYSVTLAILCATPMRRFRSTIHFDTMLSSPAISW